MLINNIKKSFLIYSGYESKANRIENINRDIAFNPMKSGHFFLMSDTGVGKTTVISSPQKATPSQVSGHSRVGLTNPGPIGYCQLNTVFPSRISRG